MGRERKICVKKGADDRTGWKTKWTPKNAGKMHHEVTVGPRLAGGGVKKQW